MIKPESLREHLASAIPELATHPERMLVFIENGTLHCTGTGSLSFEYRYSLNLVLIEFPGHPDSVMIPLLAWLSMHQPELLGNPQRRPEVRFEVEVLANDRVDLSITLPLTERVGVVPRPAGGYTATHFPEPQREGYIYAETWSLFLRDQLLAQWGGVSPPDVAAPVPGSGAGVVTVVATTQPSQSRQIVFGANGTHVLWRYADSAQWAPLYALADVAGEPGSGVELRTTATHLQWRPVGSSDWMNLTDLAGLGGGSTFTTTEW